MNLYELIEGPFAAIRLTQRLVSSSGSGSKIFPPTFEGGVYCFEERRIGGVSVPCVLLDSVASSANRQEEALAALVDAKQIGVPHFRTNFSEFPEIGEVTTFNAPHRVFDAIFRDSELDGKPFGKHPLYTELARANSQNATPLFTHAPTALLFGAWDSTGSAGGLGNKFARNIVTEIVGINIAKGETRGGVRQDPLSISSHVEIEIDKKKEWQPKGVIAKKDERAKGTRPSEVNHGNILVTVEYEGSGNERFSKKGGVTCDHALQFSVITLAGLRRLRFPIDGKRDPKVDNAARAALAALGLVALTASRNRGYALRSRCDLVADGMAKFEIVQQDGKAREEAIDQPTAIMLYEEAVERAQKAGLPWDAPPKEMKPQAKLTKLVTLSREAGME